MINRSTPNSVALETTLLVHGVPNDAAKPLAHELNDIVRSHAADPALIGVVSGDPIVGVNDDELDTLLSADDVPKLNTSNLGIALARKTHGATTVATTMELAQAAGIRVFATGGLGGVHKDFAHDPDISADLAALTRFPVAVVSSGVKSILDIRATREALETLGIPVVGYRTDAFPSFYRRGSDAAVDARFDDADELREYAHAELKRTGRAVLIANPIPHEHELDEDDWNTWVAQATEHARSVGASARDVTPTILAALHAISGGATLRANTELVKSNTDLAARLV